MTLRQRAELYLNTEHIGNQEWKALVREMLETGVFMDDTLPPSATICDLLQKQLEERDIELGKDEG